MNMRGVGKGIEYSMKGIGKGTGHEYRRVGKGRVGIRDECRKRDITTENVERGGREWEGRDRNEKGRVEIQEWWRVRCKRG